MRTKKIVTQLSKPMKLLTDKYDIEALNIFYENNKDLVFESIIDLILEGIKLKLTEIDIIEFKNPMDILVFKKIEWKGFIDRTLPYFLKKEKYETCGKIITTQKLLNQIKIKKTKSKNKEI